MKGIMIIFNMKRIIKCICDTPSQFIDEKYLVTAIYYSNYYSEFEPDNSIIGKYVNTYHYTYKKSYKIEKDLVDGIMHGTENRYIGYM